MFVCPVYHTLVCRCLRHFKLREKASKNKRINSFYVAITFVKNMYIKDRTFIMSVLCLLNSNSLVYIFPRYHTYCGRYGKYFGQ